LDRPAITFSNIDRILLNLSSIRVSLSSFSFSDSSLSIVLLPNSINRKAQLEYFGSKQVMEILEPNDTSFYILYSRSSITFEQVSPYRWKLWPDNLLILIRIVVVVDASILV
jgi:hypothetical protein